MALFLTICDLPLADLSSCNPSLAPAAAPPQGAPGLSYQRACSLSLTDTMACCRPAVHHSWQVVALPVCTASK